MIERISVFFQSLRRYGRIILFWLLVVPIVGMVALSIPTLILTFIYRAVLWPLGERWLWLARISQDAGLFYKNVWDWLDLLVVPAALALAGYFFATRQGMRDQEIQRLLQERDQAFQASVHQSQLLRAYIDNIAGLMTQDNGLISPVIDDRVRSTARALTLATFRDIGPSHKHYALLFLKEAGLIEGETPVIPMVEVSLHNAALQGINLERVNLSGAKLVGAHLQGANLANAIVSVEQLSAACVDETTRLPDGITLERIEEHRHNSGRSG